MSIIGRYRMIIMATVVETRFHGTFPPCPVDRCSISSPTFKGAVSAVRHGPRSWPCRRRGPVLEAPDPKTWTFPTRGPNPKHGKKQFFLRKTQVFDGPCGAPGRSSRRFLDSDLRSVDLTPRVVVNSTSMMFSQGVYSFETVLEKPGA